MKITLEEDNGFLNDGKPTLVILVVTDESGKSVRLPYEATKTIQELYDDVYSFFKSELKPAKFYEPHKFDEKNDPFHPDRIIKNDPIRDIAKSNTIEREDIVRCVKIHPREEGADEDLTIGDEYRVIDIKKKKGRVQYYDLLDDKADNKYRITVLPDEVELIRKRKPKTNPVKKDYKQEIVKCDECKEENAIDMISETTDQTMFQGACEKCGFMIKRSLIKNAESVAG